MKNSSTQSLNTTIQIQKQQIQQLNLELAEKNEQLKQQQVIIDQLLIKTKKIEKLQEENVQIKRDNQNLLEKIKQYEKKSTNEQFQINALPQVRNTQVPNFYQRLSRQINEKLLNQITDIVEQFLPQISSQITKDSFSKMSQSLILKKLGEIIVPNNIEYQPIYKLPQKKGTNNLELFESFYIFGVDKNILLQLDQTSEIHFDQPALLYKQYKASAENNLNEKRDLELAELFIKNSVFPFGFKAQKFNREEFEDDYLKILTCKLNNNLKNCFFTFNMNGKDFSQSSYKNFDFLHSINPNRQLYGYCLVLDDFLEEKSENYQYYWKFQKSFCFLTYFPLSEIFETLLLNIAEIFKITRAQMLSNKKKEIDGIKLIKEAEPTIKTIIHSISEKFVDFNQQTFEIDIQSIIPPDKQRFYKFQKFIFPLQKKELIFQYSRQQLVHLIIQIFNFEQFVTILSLILQEKKIIFFCDNIYILTSVIQFFQNILSPIIWVNPIIFSATEQILQYGDFEVSYLMGINQQQNYFKSKKYQLARDVNLIEIVKVQKQNCEAYFCPSITTVREFKYKPFQELEQIKNQFQRENNFTISFQSQENLNWNYIKFQNIMKMFIEDQIIKQIIPPYDEDFFSRDNQFNTLLFNSMVIEQLSKEKNLNKKSLLEDISMKNYFVEYVKSQYLRQI